MDKLSAERKVDTYLPPIEQPRGPIMKLLYFFVRRQAGTVLTPLKVHSARMPLSFGSFYGKLPRLDKKLKIPPETTAILREQVASTNMCLFCMDTTRWYVMTREPGALPLLDALPEYKTSRLFTEAQRAALDYATMLTRDKQVTPETFGHLARFYNEREICDIVWLVASEHLYNMTNIGLGIGSDSLCELAQRTGKAADPAPGAAAESAPDT